MLGNYISFFSLISPLKYSGDFRPFFTIHDSEFRDYTTKKCAPPNIILGVTNPFFAKTLQHWPHLIKLSDEDCGKQFYQLSYEKLNVCFLHTKYREIERASKDFQSITEPNPVGF